ncbi:MAG: efflux RND transporter periplasmic adaptor subunit [Gemmatales bacterium]
MQKLLLLIGVLALGGTGYWYWQRGNGPTVSYRTATVEKGDLRVGINSTGTLEPEEVVDVGAQVAGQIITLGKDPREKNRIIDYGSPVEEGTILAKIEDSIYLSQVNSAKALYEQALGQVTSAEAQVQQAEANIKRAEADLLTAQAKLFQTDRDWTRNQKLAKQSPGAVSEADYDLAESAYKTAKASVAVGEAAIAQSKAALADAKANVVKSKAAVGDAKANLDRAETNLGYCTIKSPVKGVIIDRRVNVGQTVVSSLNAPSLFLIAKDLTKMQVWSSVNEADISQIKSGQRVRFTVDAHPGQSFVGVVAPDQPRLNASMTQNVVTYTVVVNTDNTSGKLLPYLTANVDFEVNKRSDVLMVPNGDLRWKPKEDLMTSDSRTLLAETAPTKRSPGKTKNDKPAEKERTQAGMVWIHDGDLFRAVPVKLGMTDGIRTEITSGDLHEGDVVTIGETRKEAGGGGTTNPFAPQFNNKKQ